MSDNFFCIYCGRDKILSERTDEHVIPRALGGNIFPHNPFLLKNICKSCNSVCGAFVDGPFMRNSLVDNQMSLVASSFGKIEDGIALPLHYMGEWQIAGIIPPGHVCDVWLGPTGDQILHFHKPYPQVKGTLGMTRPLLKDIDPGFVVSFIVATNPEWHHTILLSILNAFNKKTEIIIGNTDKVPGRVQGRDEVSKEKQLLIDSCFQAIQAPKKMMHMKRAMDIGFAERFQAKVALGLGGIYLKDEFQRSDAANLLREFLWEKDTEERRKKPLHGSSLLSENQQLKQIIGFDTGVTVFLTAISGKIAAYVNLFQQMDFTIQISDSIDHWSDQYRQEGIVMSCIPGLKKGIGPLPMINFVTSISDPKPGSKLQLLLDEVNSAKVERPPFHLNVSDNN